MLRKLLWFQSGGGASGNQWRDVVSILRVSGDGLDRGYLEGWSQRLGAEDLLRRAWAEAGEAAL